VTRRPDKVTSSLCSTCAGRLSARRGHFVRLLRGPCRHRVERAGCRLDECGVPGLAGPFGWDDSLTGLGSP